MADAERSAILRDMRGSNPSECSRDVERAVRPLGDRVPARVLPQIMCASSTPLLTIPPFSTTSTQRLQALYSDFARQKHSNPDSYHANITWWQDALCKLLWSGVPTARGTDQAPNRLILSSGRDLVESLRMKGVGRPLSIGTVVVGLHVCQAVYSLINGCQQG